MTLSPSNTARLERVIDLASLVSLGLLLIACPIWIFSHQEIVRANLNGKISMKLIIGAIALCTFCIVWLIFRYQESKGRVDMSDRRIRLSLVIAPLIPLLAYIVTSLNS